MGQPFLWGMPSSSVGRSDSAVTDKQLKRTHTRLFLTLLVVIAIALSGIVLNTSRNLVPFQAVVRDHPVPRRDISLVHTRTNDRQDRVYCMVPFIWNEEIYNAIMQTWGKRCDAIHFYTDAIVGAKLAGDRITETDEGYKPYWEFPIGTFPTNVVFINMTRSWNNCVDVDRKGIQHKSVCRHIWEKMWRSWIHVDNHHLDKAEWFCKVDYDTFFFPDNLKYFVRDYKQWNADNEHHYFGHWFRHRKPHRDPMILGAAACWSRKTLHDIADVYRNMPKGSELGERGICEDRAQATEEVSTSLCLKKHLNVDPEPARDEFLREYITIDKIDLVLEWNRTKQGEWWFWKDKPAGAGQEEDCCAIRPIGLHKYKRPTEILQLEQQFFGEKQGNDVYNNLRPRTRKYVDKVRRAMGIDP